MRAGLLGKLKQNSAFTMMEMLVVVAVMTVLLGLSVLGISQLVVSLKMTELDNHAKTIFLEAQNQLSSIEVEGGLPRVYDEMMDSYSTRFLQEKAPQDYNVDVNGDDWKQLCYVTKEDALTTENLILASSNAYQMGGNYLIEFNPQTGDIYGVFYWESDASISYTSVVQTLEDRTVASRTETRIGYYGGQSQSTIATGIQLDSKVELVNEEELYVKVSMDPSSRLLTYYRYPDALQMECTITDESGNVWNTTLDVNKAVEGERLEFYLLLDSVEQGYSFAEITAKEDGTPALNLGDDLTVTVKSTFEQGAYFCVEERTSNTENSLWAKKEQTDDAMKLQIDTVRHLKNLAFYNETEVNTVSIVQGDDIDFDNKNFAWNAGKYVGAGATRPITHLAPIKNSILFENAGGTDITIVDGNDFELKNLVITATESNAGIFSVAQNVDFKNLKIEDITVNASNYNNVGALAGYVTACMIEDCGVYLTTYSEKQDGSKNFYNQNVYLDGEYNNEMEERYDKKAVFGNENVGGLFGSASGTNKIENSFAAIKVKGNSAVGGLVGISDGAEIYNSYASGNVSCAGSFAGGLLGIAYNSEVVDAYSTSNLYAAANFGGFLGYSSNSTYTNCFSYGEVLNTDGSNVGLINAGGFVNANNNVSNTYNNCLFLKQNAYNATGLSDVVGSQGYSDFLPTNGSGIGSGNSYPYDATLLHKVFPFKAVTEKHYGDWPVQYVMNTSLVYYEKYKNQSGSYEYGYYCIARMTNREDANITNDYIWVLDTLQDRECVEDGYALLSTHNLSKFSYTLNIGMVSSNTTTKTGTLEIGEEGEEASNRAIYISQQGTLEFNAYTEQKNDYTNIVPVENFSVSGMYLYQLPYELQYNEMVDRNGKAAGRYNVSSFYDQLIVYAAYAKGNDGEGATPVIGGNSLDTGITFYYCPHFAKAAINPNTSGNTANNPAEVYIRSARQLNALGRFPYYWNDKGGADPMTFVQETDVNFGTYTDGTKKYCGANFDLMNEDPSNPVANHSIGEPEYANTYAQFRNVYDGQCNKIIDFRLYSEGQFTGLFGEITSAELKNIVMTVSKKGAGKITGTFIDENSRDFNNKRAGIGALVGLLYESSSDEGNYTNSVENCVAVGYQIEYIQNPATESGTQVPTGIAIGGLVGYSMSDITNCAAANDIKFTANCDYGENQAIFMGGLAGSFWFGTMQNAYSGGTIDVDYTDENGNPYEIIRLRIGGVCPGYLNTGESGYSSAYGVYKNVYSYTAVSDNVWGMDDFDHIIPAVSRMQVVSTNSTSATTELSVPLGYLSAYLDFVYEDHLTKAREHDSDVFKYFTRTREWFTVYGKTCDALTYDALTNVGYSNDYIDDSLKYEISNFEEEGNLDTIKQRAAVSYPFDENLEGKDYPFPEFIYRIVKDENGNEVKEFIHYGDWPLKEGE